ncbi:hypothetical protein GE09DRAFT_1173128 [Coniochaeta sp. 2T2.1]|nr:hypothetical protein GE09DRAFT_1173128 [Coniochaeta sp. 2T2.1]
MKSLAIFPLCAAVAFAHSHEHHEAHIGYTWTSSSPCFKSEENDQEYCVFTDTTFAENRGTTVVTTPERAALFQRNPSFTDPSVTRGTNQDLVRTIPAKYTVQPIPGKGLGAVATTFISRGQLIMANTASLVFDYGAYESLSEEEYLALQASAVDSLPPNHRQHVLNMSTHDEDANHLTYPELVEKLTSTNAFDVDPAEDDPDQDNKFFTIFPEIARMNHDCRPNADYYFDLDSLSQYVHAVRDIYPGEEITVTYLDPTMSQRARSEKLLSNWGFQCSCPSCTASPAQIKASDDRLRQIAELRPEFNRHRRESSRATPQMAELMVSLYEQEKLWGWMQEAYRYAAVEWNGAGEPWTASKYASLAVEYGIYCSGERDGDVEDMEELVSDPWGHWSWMFRTRKRMGWGTGKGKGAGVIGIR